MNKHATTVIYRVLRAVQITIVFFCFILETIQYEAFSEFHQDQGIPASAYFSGGITKSTNNENFYYNGVKVYYYIVLLLTIIDSGFYVTRATGPFKRDISINAFFTALWMTSGLANIYPTFSGYGFTCDTTPPGAMSRECNAGVLGISFGWINGILFFLSTLVALRLWKGRQERYEGERRVQALGEVVYKYKPRPNTVVRVDEPEQVMIYKTFSKNELKRQSYLSSEKKEFLKN